jgi:hypothetical protein
VSDQATLTDKAVLTEDRGGILVITINRPMRAMP